ncbi:short chain dehydrogenase/reductase [Xylariaceae sp. FL1019]|nr:short chain dehydrogenase/reductase [Xylariaceae sp. FL1019]
MAAVATEALRTVTSALGAGVAVYLSHQLINAARLYSRPSGLHRYRYVDEAGRGAWAMVTGSSDGIGKCLASELAGNGFNVVLHGRNAAKLENVRHELQIANPDVDFRILVADGSQCHRPETVDFEEIKRQLSDLHLTVLINCAGAGPSPSFGALEKYDSRSIIDGFHLNAAFPAALTATLLPFMRGDYDDSEKEYEVIDRRTSKRGCGVASKHKPILIINIGSVTTAGFPLVSFYSAGKAASHVLHQAIARESALDGWNNVEIISHRVGATTSVSRQQAPPSLFRPSATTMAKAVLARTGCGRKSITPYWPHALQQAFLTVTPEWLMERVLYDAMREERRIQEEGVKSG